MHVSLSRSFKKRFFKNIPCPKVSFIKGVIDDLSTFLCPPIYLDWDLIYCLGKSTGISIKECWVRSMKLFAAYNLLFFLEHLILMVPLITLKVSIDERNSLLMRDFPPNADEELSTQITSSLLIYGLLEFASLPFVSFALVYLYFTRGHAWSRILRTNI